MEKSVDHGLVVEWSVVGVAEWSRMERIGEKQRKNSNIITDTWVEEYAFDALKSSQVKQSFPKSIVMGLTNGSEARYAFLVIHWNDSPPPSLASTIFWISSGSLKLPRWFLILYCISKMGIAAVKASPCEDDCLFSIYKACVREDEVPVRCITYHRMDGTCDLGDQIFVYMPSAECNIKSKV